MGANLSYLVETEFKTKGDPTGGLDEKAKKTGSIWSKLGSSIGNTISSIGSKIVDIGVTGVKFGLAAGIGAATYGVMGLNRELETTKTSFAAVFSAQGITKDVSSGLDKASQIIEVMRKDAAQLPGEFEDLVGIFQSGIGSALNAGLTAETFEKVSANAMAAGKALSVPLDQAGRELALLLEGRAGSQNVFGTRLGIHAQGFNDKSSEERVKIIQERLDKFQPAIAAFGKTFDAIWSTTISDGKEFLQIATQPLFEVAKDTLNDINKWFVDNRGQIQEWGIEIGLWLKYAFLDVKDFIKEWYHPALQFITEFKNGIVEIYSYIKPLVDLLLSASGALLKMSGGSAAGLVAAYGGYKLLRGIGKYTEGTNASFIGKGTGFIQKVGFAGVAGYALGTKIGQGIGGFLSGDKAGEEIGGSILGGMAGGGAAGAMIGSAFGPLGTLIGGIGGAAIGGGIAAYDRNDQINEESMKATASHNQKMLDILADASYKWDEASQTLVKAGGEIDMSSDIYIGALQRMTDANDEAGAELLAYAAFIRNSDVEFKKKRDEEVAVDITDMFNANSNLSLLTSQITAQNKDLIAGKGKFDPKKNGPPAGSGNMNIQKVEITVSSNQAPGQIAKSLVHELANTKKMPVRTAGVPNYSKSVRMF
jgi:hypothetical protein